MWVALFTLFDGGVCDVPSIIFISGATPADLLAASMTAGRFPHMCVSAELKTFKAIFYSSSHLIIFVNDE